MSRNACRRSKAWLAASASMEMCGCVARISFTVERARNPEGFNEKFSWDLRTPFVKNFTIQGIELLYNESNSGSSAKARQDSYALGGQVSTKLQMGPWTATPSFLSLKWNR